MTAPSGLARPGSWSRGLWLWLSSSASMWVLWGLLWAIELLFVDHATNEFWDLTVYVVYFLGTLAMLGVGLVIWLTLGRLIDAKADRPLLWSLLVGVALGLFVEVTLRAANPYALIVAVMIVVGGYVLGPLVAARTFIARAWRIGVGVVMALGAVSLVAVIA